jgi:hypothetical protein
MKRKKRITWMLVLLVCLIIFFFIILDKPHVTGFTPVQNRSLIYDRESSRIVIKSKDASSDYTLLQLQKQSFKYEENIYLGHKNSVRLYDLNYQLVKEIALSTLGIPEKLNFHRPIKIESEAMWWTVSSDLPDKKKCSYPQGIVHIYLSDKSLRADYYEIGEFAAAAVQNDGKFFFIFRDHQSCYEIYDLSSKNIKSKVMINEYSMDFLIHLFYDDASNTFILSGIGGNSGKFIIGCIKDQTFMLIDSAEKDWGAGCLLADNMLFYNNDNRLFQYDLKSNTRTLILAPKLVAFNSSSWNTIEYDRERNVLFFEYFYRDLIGRLNTNTLFLNLATKQYYLGEAIKTDASF